jgi:hypothetical protein
MDKNQSPPPWGLSQQLMAKSLELAFEDPALAVRLVSLAVRASLYLGEPIDPFAAHAALHRSRWPQERPPKPEGPAAEEEPRRSRSRVR